MCGVKMSALLAVKCVAGGRFAQTARVSPDDWWWWCYSSSSSSCCLRLVSSNQLRSLTGNALSV